MAARIHLRGRWAADETLALPPGQSRHVQVLRLQPGDTIVLFNGEDDLEWPAEILAISRNAVDVRVAGASRAVERELPIAVTLAIGVPANERMDALVEKATELGAAAVQPLLCARSVVRLAGERAEARRRHWQAVAASASEQCGRARVARIAPPLPFDAWLAGLEATTPAGGRWLLSLSERARRPAALHDPTRGDAAAAALVVLSGPEGGLTTEEEGLALRRGFQPVSLGPRTLRADTAPLALLAWLGLADRRRHE